MDTKAIAATLILVVPFFVFPIDIDIPERFLLITQSQSIKDLTHWSRLIIFCLLSLTAVVSCCLSSKIKKPSQNQIYFLLMLFLVAISSTLAAPDILRSILGWYTTADGLLFYLAIFGLLFFIKNTPFLSDSFFKKLAAGFCSLTLVLGVLAKFFPNLIQDDLIVSICAALMLVDFATQNKALLWMTKGVFIFILGFIFFSQDFSHKTASKDQADFYMGHQNEFVLKIVNTQWSISYSDKFYFFDEKGYQLNYHIDSNKRAVFESTKLPFSIDFGRFEKDVETIRLSGPGLTRRDELTLVGIPTGIGLLRHNSAIKPRDAPSFFPESFDTALNYRGYFWGRILHKVGLTRVTGIGPGSFPLVFPIEDVATIEKYGLSENFDRPRSGFMQIYLAFGWLGIVIFFIVLFQFKNFLKSEYCFLFFWLLIFFDLTPGFISIFLLLAWYFDSRPVYEPVKTKGDLVEKHI